MDASRRAGIRKGDEFSCGVAFGHKKTSSLFARRGFLFVLVSLRTQTFPARAKNAKENSSPWCGRGEWFSLFLSRAEAVPMEGAGGAAGAALAAAFPDAAEGPEEVEREDGEDAHGGGHGSLLRERGGLSGRPRR